MINLPCRFFTACKVVKLSFLYHLYIITKQSKPRDLKNMQRPIVHLVKNFFIADYKQSNISLRVTMSIGPPDEDE